MGRLRPLVTGDGDTGEAEPVHGGLRLLLSLLLLFLDDVEADRARGTDRPRVMDRLRSGLTRQHKCHREYRRYEELPHADLPRSSYVQPIPQKRWLPPPRGPRCWKRLG